MEMGGGGVVQSRQYIVQAWTTTPNGASWKSQ